MIVPVSRADWGAQDPKRDGYYHDLPVPLLILHHEGADATPPSTHETGRRRVKAIQRYHLNHPTVDYRDIAYTMLADDHAVYHGRDWRTAPGATRGVNAISKAVCATGDYSRFAPSDQLLDRLAQAAVWLYQAGAVDTPAYDGGHRDWGSTQCPGNRLYPQIPEINRRAALLTDQEDDEMAVTEPSRVAYYQRILAASYGPPHDQAGPPYDLEADGQVGPKTRAAIEDWQRRRGFTPTGELDVTTCITLQSHANRVHATAEARRLAGSDAEETVRAALRGHVQSTPHGPGDHTHDEYALEGDVDAHHHDGRYARRDHGHTATTTVE